MYVIVRLNITQTMWAQLPKHGLQNVIDPITICCQCK